MKTIRFDSGFYLDDPNNRWGNPSYQLEPGNPGLCFRRGYSFLAKKASDGIQRHHLDARN
jgi:hypothetical protein